MKKILTGFAIAAFFAACNSNPKTALETKKDVLPFDTSGIYYNSYSTDTGTVITYVAPKRTNNTSAVNTRKTTTTRVSTPTAQTTTKTVRKKGWSHAAKGAVIGAGSGAIIGAVVSKKHGKGAIIGGIIGAAGGYVIGRSRDKKEGRY